MRLTDEARIKLRRCAVLVILAVGVGGGEAAAGVNRWTSHGPEGGGTIQALALDPSTSTTVYAGTRDGGLFKGLDGGGTWSEVSRGLTDFDVKALAIDPATPTTLYAATSGGVFKSVNGGTNWNAVNTGLTTTDVRALAIR
jgi:photosystem II stability/assembly factor-like uncharacterized protein